MHPLKIQMRLTFLLALLDIKISFKIHLLGFKKVCLNHCSEYIATKMPEHYSPALFHYFVLYPSGFLDCQFQESLAISSIPYCALNPSSLKAFSGLQ